MITYSAIMFESPNFASRMVIMIDKRHVDIFKAMFDQHITYNKETMVQGFMTDDFRFLDRYDAKIEARKCGQLIKDTEDRALYSDDIWPEGK